MDWYYATIPIISLNFFWLLLTLPIVTAPAAAFALYHCTSLMVKDETAGWNEFWEGFRKFFWTALAWYLLDAVILIIIGVNIWFYNQNTATWANLVSGLMLGVLFIWLAVQFYVPPVLVIQENRNFITALRNSAGLVATRPLVMVGTFIGLAALYFFSIVVFIPLLLVISAGLGAYLTSKVMQRTVQKALELQKPK